jgi:hypothetical protein
LGEDFMIRYSLVTVYEDGNIHIEKPDNKFNATKGLWEQLTCKKVDKGVVEAEPAKI